MSSSVLDAPEHEARIVWNEPIDDLPYVRAHKIRCPGRRGPTPLAPKPPGRVVGWTEIADDSPEPTARYSPRGGTDRFERRVFWLEADDRPIAPDGPYRDNFPRDAVDPATVEPGTWGTRL